MPIYFTDEANAELFGRINEICDVLERERGIRCSTHSRALMFNAVTAIREDPSPEWRAHVEGRNAIADLTVANLPVLISTMADQAAVNGRLTYYQLLHWLGDNLDAICPFEKTPRRRRHA